MFLRNFLTLKKCQSFYNVLINYEQVIIDTESFKMIIPGAYIMNLIRVF